MNQTSGVLQTQLNVENIESAVVPQAATAVATVPLLPSADARFDDGQPRVLIDVETLKPYKKSVWFIESLENAKLPQPGCFKIVLRPDGLGLNAQPDEETWEMMKHRGGKRLIEVAARAACGAFAMNALKDPHSKTIKLELAPKGQKMQSGGKCGTEHYDPMDASNNSSIKHMTMTLTGGPVWLPPAPAGRMRGWGGSKD